MFKKRTTLSLMLLLSCTPAAIMATGSDNEAKSTSDAAAKLAQVSEDYYLGLAAMSGNEQALQQLKTDGALRERIKKSHDEQTTADQQAAQEAIAQAASESLDDKPVASGSPKPSRYSHAGHPGIHTSHSDDESERQSHVSFYPGVIAACCKSAYDFVFASCGKIEDEKNN